jgi:hypothetical protein
MSQTMVIACHECQTFIGIGQSVNSESLVSGRLLYRMPDDVDHLELFLFTHEGHALEVGDLNNFAYDEDPVAGRPLE